MPLRLLPGLTLFAPRMADTREVGSWLVWHPSGIEAALGGDMALLGGELANGVEWRTGLRAGSFMGFHPGDSLTFHLETFDGLFGVPLEVGWKGVELELTWSHVSAHFADGLRAQGERPPEDSEPYSLEWIELGLGYGAEWFRPYAAVRSTVHTVSGETGSELRGGWTALGRGSLAPYHAFDVHGALQGDEIATVATQAGIRWSTRNGPSMRGGVTAHRGLDEAGKRAESREQYVGVLLAWDVGWDQR
ncbi:MAG: hypothetical protein QGG40_02550 [Myxococcota bacterium]|nr:hypothetical protein [Myxococcota bacterium]